MSKRIALASVAVFLLWSVLDFVIHGVLLRGTYEVTAALWRPQAEMKMGLMYVVTLLTAALFTTLYGRLVHSKSIGRGVEFGLYFGLAQGLGMGYGTYSVMPIPYILALSWFLGTVVEAAAAGAVVGLLVREQNIPAADGLVM